MHSQQFLKLPQAVQLVFIKLVNHVDKYAYCHYKRAVIVYTERTNPKLRRTLTHDQCAALADELWG